MVFMGALYQVNLLVAGVSQADADVPGVHAFPLEGVVLAAGFALSAAAFAEPPARPFRPNRSSECEEEDRTPWNGRW